MIGGVCIFASIILLVWLPRSISKPIQELTRGILEIANHNYEKRLDMSGHEEFREVADSFNRMAERLTEYRASTLNDILSAKKFLKIYADNKESYFKASYITIINAEADDDEPHNLGDVILLKNITEFKRIG